MLRLCLLELDILFFAHAAAFCIMEWLYPGWWKKQKSKSTLQKKTQTIAPGMIIRFSETASGHTYKVHWIRTVAPFQEAETLTILSNADGYVLFRRSSRQRCICNGLRDSGANCSRRDRTGGGLKMINLSNEQQIFIQKAMDGKNVLVDACIGSGKTTAIQELCNALPAYKRILYLTYNRLLKLDAKDKIHNRNVLVQNYHGFAAYTLYRAGMRAANQSDLIQTFLRQQPPIAHYDVLIIDEYQDIEEELAKLLWRVKEKIHPFKLSPLAICAENL